MTSTKYIGMDVHKESISIAVMNSIHKVVMECVIETKASPRVTFEEGTCDAAMPRKTVADSEEMGVS